MTGSSANVAFTEDGRRGTRQRRAVRDMLAETSAFASAQQVYDDLRQRGDKVGLSTVYRTLQAMAEAGEVDVLRNPDGEMLFRKCGERHHHHLVCRSCGETIEVVGPAVEGWATRAAKEHGFTEVTHTVELFGLCTACSPG